VRLHVYAENFRSYPKIDWECPDTLVLIDGVNKDTGGSNMAGKTTLLDAWFWCRYGWLPKWDGPKGGQVDGVLRRKDGEVVGGATVRVTESFGSDEIVIERRRPNRLTVWKNGAEVKGLDQKGLEKLLGMTAERFLVCVYLKQRRKRSFFWMSDAERMELLSIVAGLEDLDRALRESKERKSDLESKIQFLDGRISALQARVDELPEQLKKLEDEKKGHEDKLVWAKRKVESAMMNRDDVQWTAQSELDKFLKESTEKFEGARAELRLELGTLQDEKRQLQLQVQTPVIEPEYDLEIAKASEHLKQCQAQEKAIEEAIRFNERLIEQLNHELDLAEAAKNGACKECSQPLPEPQRTAKALGHLENAKKLKAQTREIPAAPDPTARQELDRALGARFKRQVELNDQPRRIQAEIARIDAELQKKLLEEKTLIKDQENETRAFERSIDERIRFANDQLDKASVEMDHLEKMLQAAQSAFDSAASQRDQLLQGLAEARQEHSKLQEELNETLDLIEIFGPKGYRAICFDGLVEKISARAGQLLSVMTEGLYSTRLEQVGQDSKGNQKLILRPVMIKGGHEVFLDDLSGGAEARAALAYDVAVAESAGDGLPLLLDEALEGLDAVGKSEAMTLLEEVAKTRPVLVVDHASEFKAMFRHVVRVVYENEESRLEAV
jgi:DNA repair exonuclease SbcCD ATPase subunit